MRYHTNAIGSLFGLFGGRRIIAVPDMDDVAGMPEIRIDILRTIADSDRLLSKLLKDDSLIDQAIKADKVADYQEKLLKVNGYYGNAPDFEQMAHIKQDMAEDWWLSPTLEPPRG